MNGPQATTGFFTQTNLVSNGAVPADHIDANLVNPWGIALSPTSPFWVADNGTGLSTLYNGSGTPQALVVTIPPPAGGVSPSAPTGIVFNSSTTDFLVTGGAAHFLFATEDGTIAGWNSGTTAQIVVDNSASGAVYKGLAIGSNAGANFIYATNFHTGKVDVFDRNFAPS